MIDSSPVVDLHCDLIESARRFRRDPTRRHRDLPRLVPLGNSDFPRLRDGGCDLIISSVYSSVLDTNRPDRCWSTTKATFTFTREVVDRDPRARLVASAAEARKAAADGVLGVIQALEGGHLLGGRPERLAKLRSAGLVSVGLAHLVDNGVAGSCGAISRPRRGPLTGLGRQIVDGCRKHGVLVDLAHAHPEAFADVLAHDGGPVFVSHAGACRAHPKGAQSRLLTDEQISEVAARGGCIGVIFAPQYLKGSPFGSMEDVAGHLDAIAEIAGPEATALGSDWDGMVVTPKGLQSPAGLRPLCDLLRRRGWSDSEIRGALGENFLRFWETAVPT